MVEFIIESLDAKREAWYTVGAETETQGVLFFNATDSQPLELRAKRPLCTGLASCHPSQQRWHVHGGRFAFFETMKEQTLTGDFIRCLKASHGAFSDWLQFHYRDDWHCIVARDRKGFFPTREDFEELIELWRKFYEQVTDEEIASFNEKRWKALCDPDDPENSRTESKPGFIYVLAGEGYYKIGKAINLERRIGQISPRLPFKIEVIHAIETDDMDKAELLLHRRFASKRTNGEWFQLDNEDVTWLCDLKRLVSFRSLE